jgi:hypothetical protein
VWEFVIEGSVFCVEIGEYLAILLQLFTVRKVSWRVGRMSLGETYVLI